MRPIVAKNNSLQLALAQILKWRKTIELTTLKIKGFE